MAATKRFFLFGGAAAIATAKVALASAPAAIYHEVLCGITRPRLLYQINISGHDAIEPAMIELRRALTGDPVLQFAMPPRNWGRWSGSPVAQIVEMPNQLLVLSVDGGGADAWDVEMFYDEGGRRFLERHAFPSSRGPMARIAMEA